jgi:mutator protein MutT
MKIIKVAKKVDTAVMVVLNPEGKALLLKRGADAEWMPDRWNLPGGVIEEGENHREAAIRECQEESGITPTNVEHVGVFGRVDAFVGKTDSNDVTINFESSDEAWVDLKNIKDYDPVTPAFEIIEAL